MLAPMVRAGTLPLRLLSLRYGADTVYGEELIDLKVMKLQRVENAALRTVDFVLPNSKVGAEPQVVFRTLPAEERGRLVFQLGSANPRTAVAAAKVVAADVDGIDLNMGCPKKFSTQGGMGAALLKDKETAVAIVRALRAELPARIAVSCKVRLLEDTERTVALVRKLVDAGAHSVAIHLRQADWANSQPADWTQLRAIMDAVPVPVVANGSVFEHADIAKVRAAAGDVGGAPRLGVMIARGALVNPSMFRADAETLDVVIRRYLRLCAESANAYQNTKYTVQRILQEAGAKVTAALGDYRSVQQLCRCKGSEEIILMWCKGDADGRGPCGDELGRDALLAALRAALAARACEDDGRVYTDDYILDARNEMGHGVGSAVVRTAAELGGGLDDDERAGKRPRVEAGPRA
jgi:tRNA-dihydrouridine synthase 2